MEILAFIILLCCPVFNCHWCSLALSHTVDFRKKHPAYPSTDLKRDLIYTAEGLSVLGKKIVVILC